MEGLNTRKPGPEKPTIRNLSGSRIGVSQDKIRGWLSKITTSLGCRNKRSLGIGLVSDKEITRINRRYLSRNRVTDVIAFAYSPGCADLIISVDTAKRNARLYKTSLAKELLLYIIHGILHLEGYDDALCRQRKRMFKKQEEIFKRISGGTQEHKINANPKD